MSRDRADQLFARFRRGGEPAALAALFDATAGELMRIALYLGGDPHVAEDLVQSAFLVAIENAARFDEQQRVLPWLLGIMANRARLLKRQQARKLDPERAARAAAPDPADEAARREFAAALQRALQQMASPYKEVLVLHLEHGLSAKEIGAALSRPAGTVRTQVVRGLELLRAALPAGFAAAAFVALAPARGLAAVREAVLAQAMAKSGAAAAGALGAIGGAMVMKKMMLVGAVALLAAAAWIVPWTESGPIATASGNSTAPAYAVLPERSSVAKVASPTMPERLAVALPAEPVETGAARIMVAWQEDRGPAVALQVTCRRVAPARREKVAAPARLRTDAAGTVTFANLEPGDYAFSACRRQEQVRVDAGQTCELRLLCKPDFVLDGIVVDPKGGPIAGAHVVMADEITHRLCTLAVSAADGAFGWRGELLDPMWAIKDGCVPGKPEIFEAGAAPRQHVLLELGPLAGALRGTVVDPSGTPVADALVMIATSEVSGRHGNPVLVRTDGRGRFATSQAATGEQRVIVAAQGFAPLASSVLVGENGEEVVLRLTYGATVRGTVRGPKGESLAATVSTTPLVVGVQSFDLWFTTREVRTDASGRFELTKLPAIPLRLTAACGKRRGAAHEFGSGDLADGRSLVWDPVLEEGLAIRGRVVDAEDRPLARWKVYAQRLSIAHGVSRCATTDARGTFELDNLPDGDYRLAATLPSVMPTRGSWAATMIPWAIAERVAAGSSDVVLRARPERGGWFTGTVVSADGAPPAHAMIEVLDGANAAVFPPRDWTGTDGTFRIGPLPPGDYRLVIDAGHGRTSLAHDLLPGTKVELGTIRIPGTGTVTVRLRRPDRSTVHAAHLWLASTDNGAAPQPVGDGTWRAAAVVAGSYRLQAWGTDFAPFVREAILVREGEDAHLDVTVEGATTVRLVLHRPAVGTLADRSLTAFPIVVRAGAGEEILRDLVSFERTGTFVHACGLRPGSYTFESAREGATVRAAGAFTVPSDAREPLEVQVEYAKVLSPR